MKIELIDILIKSFKGLKDFKFDPQGRNATITGANGTGKTTVYDAFKWLLFNKNSANETAFDLRPLDKDNLPIKGLVACVEAVIEIDGTSHTLKKEHHERIIKREIKGFETLCWIDDVPKKVKDYNDYIAEIIPEDTFKLLTDVNEFNGNLHWSDRRNVLMDIAGGIGTPDGFDELIAELKGRSLDDFKKVKLGEKKRLVDEQKEINPRLDEIQQSLKEYAGDDEKTLNLKRKNIKGLISKYDDDRKLLLEIESDRTAKFDAIRELQIDLGRRESELLNDTSGIKKLLDEKQSLGKKIQVQQQVCDQINSDIMINNRSLSSSRQALEAAIDELEGYSRKYRDAQNDTAANACYACGQTLPADKLNEIADKKKSVLIQISGQGKGAKERVETLTGQSRKLETNVLDLKNSLEAEQEKLDKGKTFIDKRLPEIDDLIKNNPKKDKSKDIEWLSINNKIEAAEGLLSESNTEKLEQIEKDRMLKVDEMQDVDKALAQSDQRKESADRITELEAREKELGQKIATIEKSLYDIGEYIAAESAIIESAVNGKFKHATFKLFNTLLNGSIEDCCVALYKGRPYPAMSTGEKIVCGVDVINVLSDHFGYSVPLFVDNKESLTKKLESKAQTICLVADVNEKSLKIS